MRTFLCHLPIQAGAIKGDTVTSREKLHDENQAIQAVTLTATPQQIGTYFLYQDQYYE